MLLKSELTHSKMFYAKQHQENTENLKTILKLIQWIKAK